MSNTIEYRGLRSDDWERMIHIWSVSGLRVKPQGRDSREHIAGEIARNPDWLIGAYDGDTLIGLIIGTYDGRRGCLNRLAVLPEYRHRGIARRLVELCDQRLRQAGALIVYGLIDRENDASRSLFSGLGYHLHEDILYYSKRDNPEV